MLEICANNIHLMLIKNEQKLRQIALISFIIYSVLIIILSLKKRHPRLRCFKTERDAFLNIYISSILMLIPKHYINQIIIFLYSDNHEV